MDSDIQQIADDNYKREMKSKHVSPIIYSQMNDRNIHRPISSWTSPSLNRYHNETANHKLTQIMANGITDL